MISRPIERIMMRGIGLFVACTIVSFSYPQELGEWRLAEDTMEPTDDKQVHAVGSFGLYYLFICKGFSPADAMKTTLGLGILKEGIDALVPWETYGRWGGDGWSTNDILYDIMGAGAAYSIDKLWKPNNKKIDVKINKNGFNIGITLQIK